MELKVTAINNQPADIFNKPEATTKSDDQVESQEISNNPAQVINMSTETTNTTKEPVVNEDINKCKNPCTTTSYVSHGTERYCDLVHLGLGLLSHTVFLSRGGWD
jgi:hypothetical protein